MPFSSASSMSQAWSHIRNIPWYPHPTFSCAWQNQYSCHPCAFSLRTLGDMPPSDGSYTDSSPGNWYQQQSCSSHHRDRISSLPHAWYSRLDAITQSNHITRRQSDTLVDSLIHTLVRFWDKLHLFLMIGDSLTLVTTVDWSYHYCEEYSKRYKSILGWLLMFLL